MAHRLGGRIATALAGECWQNTHEYLLGRADRPRFKASAGRNTVWNNDDKSGLLLRDDFVIWSCKTTRKNLRIPLDLRAISRPRRAWLDQAIAEGRLRRVGIQREMVRGRERLFALVCLEGAPYRSEEYLSSVGSSSMIGLDLGPTWLAGVSDTTAFELSIADSERIREDTERRKKERRLKRAADRSRRAANPHARRKNGRAVKGVRQPQRSKRGLARQLKLADTQRKDAQTRKRHRQEAVREVMRHGKHVAIEDLGYRAWQQSLFGRRMMITAPGEFTSRLKREAELLGGSVTLIDPWQARASQTCLCGAWTGKKSLAERTHACPSCGLVASRDLVAAAVVRELALANATVWNEGLALASGTQHQTMRLLAASSRRTPSSSSTTPGMRGEKQDTPLASSDASGTVLLCVNGSGDPVENTPALVADSRAPMREHPKRMGTSRKALATVKKQPHRASPNRSLSSG